MAQENTDPTRLPVGDFLTSDNTQNRGILERGDTLLFVLPFCSSSLTYPSTTSSRAEALTNLLLTKSRMVFVRPTSFLAN
jgi:hypothetical protein